MTATRFITLEGGEGTGKSTQVRLLGEALGSRGLPVLLTREPGGSPGAELLRSLLLSGKSSFTPQAETLLHFAAREDHLARTIRPALARGRWVVCDRFFDSTMAYQGYGLGADRAEIATLIGLVKPWPDLTVILDLSEELARARLAARGGGPDRYEQLGPEFHARVRAGFRAIAMAEPARCVLVAADGAASEVHRRVMAVLRTRLGLDGGA